MTTVSDAAIISSLNDLYLQECPLEERVSFSKEFLQKTPLDFTTSFDSVSKVADKISEPGGRLFVAINETGKRGFLITREGDDNMIHTMFTLPCTEETKVPSLFKEMLSIVPFDTSEGVVFWKEDGYNADMMRFFHGSAKHAGIVSTEKALESPASRLKRVLDLQYKSERDQLALCNCLQSLTFPTNVVQELGIRHSPGVLVVGTNQAHVDLVVKNLEKAVLTTPYDGSITIIKVRGPANDVSNIIALAFLSCDNSNFVIGSINTLDTVPKELLRVQLFIAVLRVSDACVVSVLQTPLSDSSSSSNSSAE